MIESFKYISPDARVWMISMVREGKRIGYSCEGSPEPFEYWPRLIEVEALIALTERHSLNVIIAHIEQDKKCRFYLAQTVDTRGSQIFLAHPNKPPMKITVHTAAYLAHKGLVTEFRIEDPREDQPSD